MCDTYKYKVTYPLSVDDPGEVCWWTRSGRRAVATQGVAYSVAALFYLQFRISFR
jgi:hypothetical protein